MRRVVGSVVLALGLVGCGAGESAAPVVAEVVSPTSAPTTAPVPSPEPPTAVPPPTALVVPATTPIEQPTTVETATPVPTAEPTQTSPPAPAAESPPPAAATPVPAAALLSQAALVANGSEVYTLNCARCHGENGLGSPPYRGIIGVGDRYTTAGMIEELTNGHPVTFGFADRLSAEEIASVVVFVKATFP